MHILKSTSTWRRVTALILVVSSCFFFSEAIAKSRKAAASQTSASVTNVSSPSGTTVAIAQGTKTPVTTSPTTQPVSSAPGPSAPTPASGTLSPGNPTITYTDGPLITNTTGLLGPPVCNAPGLCSDFTLTVNAASVAATKQILIEGTWTPTQNDFDFFIENTSGQVIAAQQSTANPSALILSIPADGTVYHIVTEASLGAGNLNFVIKLVDKPNPVNQGPGVPPRYMNYPAPVGLAPDSGEPSISVDWNPNVGSLKHDLVNTGGVVFFTSESSQFQTSFDDCCSPALNPWTDITASQNQVTSLDTIGFTDHYTTAELGIAYPPPHTPGRTFNLDLAAGDSLMTFTDDDGATHMPSQGGGLPAGPDHETLGAGPFHAPVITPPAPAYPNAVYYCSQSLTEAECSRSDDGGVTFGPGVVIYTPSQCLGGIHGHVKVSPQGTVYVPNSSCAVGSPPGANGAAVSTNNGVTWNEVTVPGSTGSQDPSIGIGQNNVGKPPGQVPNTAYLGWISADGHAHVAHSGDEGATWQDDIDVGSILGVQNAVFPAVVAGDDNRAAYGFLGTTTSGIGAFSDDGNFQGIWHLYIATTYDGGHNWILVDATPDDPVQMGQVCLKGTGCNGNTRNLLDFNDFTVDAQGRGLFGYADGCVNCLNQFAGQSKDQKGTIARQSGGRRLFAAFDPVEPAPPAAPQILSAIRQGSPAGVLVSWLKPDNGGSPITSYRVYRGTSSGTEVFLASVSGEDTNKYLDTSADSFTNYYYRVTAVNAISEGAFCREVNINGTAAGATACLAPYITKGGPGINGNISPDPSQGELTIQSISVGEPFTNCNDNSVTLVMKVKTLDPGNTGQPVLPPNAQWKFNFVVTTPDNVDHEIFVSMDTFAFNGSTPAAPTFSYGRKDPTATGTQEQMECFEQAAGGVEVFHCPNLSEGAAPSASFTKDGTITMKLNFSTILSFSTPQAPGMGSAFTWDGSAVGTKLKHLRGQTILLAGAFLEVVQTTGSFPEETGGHCSTCPDYTRIGNIAGCNTVVPLAVLNANPLTGNAPLSVSFDGSGSFEPFGACGAINSYTMDFGDGSNPVTQSSPIFNHTYNSPGDYRAELTVRDSIGHTSVNAAEAEIHVASINPPALSNTNPVVSRMTHGTGGPTFDVNLPLTGTRGVECRSGGANGNYQMVFTFQHNLVSVVSAGIATGTGTVTSSGIGPNLNQYTVNLTGVANQQYLSVNLLTVKDNTGAVGNIVGPQMGVLVGDTTANGITNSSDISQTQMQSGQLLTQSNFRTDVTLNGAINSSDISLVQSKSGTALPSSP